MIIGIDLGGTKVAGGVVNDGRIIKTAKLPTGKEQGSEHIMDQLRRVIQDLSEGDIEGIAIGVPGYFRGTKIELLPNMPDTAGKDLSVLHENVVLGNDAKCFTIGEHKHGAGKGHDTIVGITLGTGVGTGVIFRGDLFSMRVPEIGHMITDPDAQSYAPGKTANDWESYLAGSKIMERYRKEGGQKEQPSDIWKCDTELSDRICRDTAKYLTIFCANIVRLYGPSRIVVGGGVANDELISRANARMPDYGCEPIIRMSELKEDAAILGAASLLE